MKNLLVTGGAGFIGSNFINHILETRDDVSVVNLDKLTYAGNLENLKDSEKHPHYKFIKGDIQDKELVDEIFKNNNIKHVINFAAESHVDRSILSSEIFYQTNVLGTHVLLEVSRKFDIERFIQVSTDEVYGSLGEEGVFTETTPLSPNSPYAASKASADLMAMAFQHTYDLPVIVTRCTNNYGPFQFPEKFIPLMIINALNEKKLPVYGDGLNVRDWIYVLDHCKAIEVIWEKGDIAEVYNIGAEQEMKNIDIVKILLNHLNKSEDLIEFVKDRPGHDRRYAIDAWKIKSKLGWKPEYSFEEALTYTIDWYLSNKAWSENVMSGEYQDYYKIQYNG